MQTTRRRRLALRRVRELDKGRRNKTEMQDEKKTVAEFGVDIDDEDPRTVRVWNGAESYPCRFSTEADAKMADALTTRMMEIICELWIGGAELLQARTWPSGERPADEPPAPRGEGAK
jgi:hypothetical protein